MKHLQQLFTVAFLFFSLLGMSGCNLGFLGGTSAKSNNSANGPSSSPPSQTNPQNQRLPKLASIELEGPSRAKAGQCVALTVKLKGASGQEFAALAPTIVALVVAPLVGQAHFFQEATCSTIGSVLTIEPGQATVTTYFKHEKAGTLSLVATVQNVSVGIAIEIEPGDPTRLILESLSGNPKISKARTNQCTEFGVRAADEFGNEASAPSAVLVELAGNGSGSFYRDKACQFATLSTVLGTNALRTTFFYLGTEVESLLFEASATSLASATLAVEVVNAGFSDPEFGHRGVAQTGFGPRRDNRATAVLTLPDGKLLVVGNSLVDGHFDVALARYHASGKLDESFGDSGKVLLDLGSDHDNVTSAKLVDGGSIVLGGSVRNSDGHTDFVLAKISSSGVLDSSFGDSGIVRTDFWDRNDGVQSLALSLDGLKIIAAGYATTISNQDFAVARYLVSDGSLDTSFSGDGKFNFGFPTSTHDSAYDVAMAPDGKIVLVGSTRIFGYNRFAVARLLADGSFDSSFAIGGLRFSFVYDNNNVAYAVAVRPNKKIVFAGTARAGTRDQLVVLQLTEAGVQDENFNSGFVFQRVYEKSGSAIANSLALQTDGKVVVVGYASQNNNGRDLLALRLGADGTQDTSFGNFGHYLINRNDGNEQASAIAVAAHRIFVAGHAGPKGLPANFFLTSLIPQ